MEFSSNVQAFTQNYLAPKAVDTILNGNVLAMRLIANGEKWRGRTMDKTIVVTKQPNGSSFSGLDTFSTAQSDTKRKLSFDVRGYEIPIVIPGMERDMASADPGASIDLVIEAMEEAQNAGMDDIGTMLYADGTGNSSKDFLGLGAIIDDGGEVATYGGLSRSTNTSIKAQEYDVTGNVTLSALATAVSASSRGTDVPTLHVTTKTLFDQYETLLQSTVTSNINVEGYKQVTRTGVVPSRSGLAGDIGFNSLFFRGIPVVADDKCPTGKWWGINEKYLKWFGLPTADPKYKPVMVGGNKQIEGVYADQGGKNVGFSFSGLLEPVNQYAQVGHIILLGNLISFNPNRHFAINFS